MKEGARKEGRREGYVRRKDERKGGEDRRKYSG